MPVLIKYERKPLTMAQVYAVRDYIARKRVKKEISASDINETNTPTEKPENQDSGSKSEGPIGIAPPPSAKEIREEKERCLAEISGELSHLENTLEELKGKKHILFEELKSFISSEKEKKKAAEEKERQLHGFPSPAMAQLASQTQGNVMNISPPYKNPMGIVGNKRPKSPSPPLVQIYSTNHANPQSMYEMSQSSPAQPHHPLPGQAHNVFGEAQRSSFQAMGSKVAGHPESLHPGYQYQSHHHGAQVNPHAPTSPQAQGSLFGSQERQFLEQRHSHDRQVPSFSYSQSSPVGSSAARGSQSRQLPSQQQNQTNMTDNISGFNQFTKERPGFTGSNQHRAQGQMKRGSHLPNRSRYY